VKNVFRPLQEVATHKGTHIQQLTDFRDMLENLLDSDAASLKQVKVTLQIGHSVEPT
jgi:hypothetical protein